MIVFFLGDSIQNILGDIVSCGLGYIIGTVFLAVELWWLSLVWILISEVGKLLFNHDLRKNGIWSGCLHLVHEGQTPDDRPHPACPFRQAEDLAVLQDPQEQQAVFHLPPVEVQPEGWLPVLRRSCPSYVVFFLLCWIWILSWMIHLNIFNTLPS